MGQTQTITENLIPEAIDTVQVEIMKHSKVFQEIGSLSYEEFQTCLQGLNELSRRCLDPGGKQLVFFVKKGTDTSLLWKATVKIACVKVDPVSREIDNYKFLNLKQFLSVFKTFQTNLHSLVSAEEQSGETASMMMISLPSNFSSPTNSNCSSPDEPWNECSICMDRKMDVLLPCAHSFCTPCIEQWNENNKSCPICCEELKNTDESWVMTDKPGADEISDNICKQFMSLGKNEIN